MLKKRIIPLQLLSDGRLVKSVRFTAFRDVGDPVSSARVYNAQYADELVLLNVDRGQRSIAPLAAVIERVSAACFMPLTAGGGVHTAAHAAHLIRCGADRIIVNSAAYGRTPVLRAIADEHGAQAVVSAIDVRRDPRTNDYVLYSDCGRIPQARTLEQHIELCVEQGAGELMITSIDRDGTMQGFDMELVARAVRAAAVPVIAAGGAGNYEHLRVALAESAVSAVACGSLFNFTDSNPIRARAFLMNRGIPCKVV